MRRSKMILPIMLLAAMFSISGCKADSAEILESEIAKNESLEDFKYTADTKVYLKMNDSETEITEYVTNYQNGDIYVTPQLIEKVLDVEQSEMTEEEIADFERAEAENGLKSPENAEFIKFEGPDTKVIMRAGSKLYCHNGMYAMLGSAVVKTPEGDYSCQMTDLVLKFGFSSLGTSVRNNQIFNTLY